MRLVLFKKSLSLCAALGNKGLRLALCVVIVEAFGHLPQGGGGVLHPKEAGAHPGNAHFVFHAVGQIHHGAGALHYVELGSRGLDERFIRGVARKGGNNGNAHLAQVVADDPHFARKVVVAKDVDALDLGLLLVRLHKLHKGVAGHAVACGLGARKARGLDRDDADAVLFFRIAAHGFHIVADNAHNTGGVHKDELGRIVGYGLVNSAGELFRAAKDDVFFLQVGGKTVAEQFRAAGEAAANIPGVTGAADGAVNDMKGIGNGV